MRLFSTAVAATTLALTGFSAVADSRKDNRRDRPIKADLPATGLLGSIGGTIGPDGALHVPQSGLGEITAFDLGDPMKGDRFICPGMGSRVLTDSLAE
jgi:hypothetical protein